MSIFLTLCAFALTDAFEGRILDTAGQPIENALVATCAAPMRVEGVRDHCAYGTPDLGHGAGHHCRWCQPDRGPQGTTDALGRFSVMWEDRTRQLLIVAAADGYRSRYMFPIHPGEGPLDIVLEACTANTTSTWFGGRVLDSEGAPLSGASLLVIGRRAPDTPLTWRSAKSLDKIVTTTEEGTFRITGTEPWTEVWVRVRGVQRAPLITRLAQGCDNSISLKRGHRVRGRVVDEEGSPISNLVMSVVSEERHPQHFLGPFDGVTDPDGHFVIDHVPADAYRLFSRVDRRTRLVVSLRPLSIPSDDSNEVDVGVLIARPGHTLSGRVELGDASSQIEGTSPEETLPATTLPAGIQLMIVREEAWDLFNAPLGPEGAFSIGGLPDEVHTLSVYLPGYRPSALNVSRDPERPQRLIGRIDQDIDDLLFLLEPEGLDGETARPPSSQPRLERLRGAPSKR